ncbi:hypothetical protein Tco_1240260, partial [Tanacetum coccineum]
METASRFLAKASGCAGDGCRVLVTTPRLNRLNEALEDSARRRRRNLQATLPR